MNNCPIYLIKLSTALMGAYVTTNFLFKTVKSYYDSQIRPQADLVARYGKGSYAIITGGAQGIGREFALDLAKKGFNLLIFDKDYQAMEDLKTQISQINSNLLVKIVEVDFSKLRTAQEYIDLTQQLTSIDVSILINNVGTAMGASGIFDQIDAEIMQQAYHVNLYPTVFFTRKLITQMKLREKKSLILNMSSCSALKPLKNYFLYGASKAFLVAFGESLYLEQKMSKNAKIEILTMTPGLISTKLIGFKKGFLIIEPKEFVDSALRQIGREHQSIGHWKHKLLMALGSLLMNDVGSKSNAQKMTQLLKEQ